MVDIVTRLGKGSPLTNAEVDANFTNLAEVSGVTGEPMGHEDRTTSTISFNASTRTFTIAPVASSFTVWCKGKKVVVSTAQTVTIPNTTGMYSIYYDANGVLSAKSGYFTFSLEAPTAYVYWNAATGTAPYFGDERHGVVLDWQTHEYLHRTRGAALASGFAASGYVLGGNGSSNSHAQITLEGGTFFDEDMKIIVTATNTPTAGTWEQDLLSPARIPVLYLSGTGWVIDAPTDYPLKQGTSRPQYNAYSGGVWSTADVANNKYATSWILATNNLTYPVIAIIGQAENDLQSAAEAVDFTALQLPGFPSVEFRPLYKLIFQCADSCTNAVHASLVSITDIRSIAAAGTAASIVTDHGNLSGLSDDDHPQYIHVDTLRTVSAAVKASFLPSQTSNAGKFLQTDGTATSWQALTSGNVTTALGFTPYNATNPSGYISGITSGMVTTALGFTPYNATNPSGYVTAAGARGAISVTGAGSYDSATGVINIVGGVTSFNTRTGAITLSSADVTTALGFTPYNNTNPSGYITGITSTMVTTALGFTPYNSSNPNGYISSITSANVTTALGFTPYNATNPSGYITSSALSGYLTSASAASTYLPLSGGTLTGVTNLYAGSMGNSPALCFGSETGGPKKAIYLETYWLVIQGHQNEGIKLRTTDATGITTDRFVVTTTGATINGNTALHAGNYNSYSPTLTGGGASGTWGISISGNAATVTNGLYKVGTNAIPAYVSLNTTADNWMWLWQASSGNDWYLGPTTANFGIGGSRLAISSSGSSPAAELSIERGTTRLLEILQANLQYKGNVVLHAGNYNSYAPTLTGTGANGTWGISISGSAASVGGLTPAQFFNNMGNNHGTYTDFNSVPGFGNYYVQGSTNSPTGISGNQFYGFTLGLGNEYSYSLYASQIYYPRRAQNSDTYIYVRDREGGSWTSWAKIRAGYADTAGSVSSISATTATGIQTNYVAGINTTTPGQTTYGIAFSGSSSTDNAQGITWGWSGTAAQAGIYVQSSGSYGTKMYFGTTDSFATGSKTSMSIDHSGTITATRESFRAPIFYDSNDTQYYLNPNSITSLRTIGSWRSNSDSWDGEFAGKIQYHSNNWYFQYASQWIFRNSSGDNVAYGDTSGNMWAISSMRSPIFYDNNNTGYYIDGASQSNLNTLLLQGPIKRGAHAAGFLEGSHNNVGGNSAYSNPIYTIGSSYNPTDSSLSNMYGVGYSHPNFWGGGKGDDWGMYVATAGVVVGNFGCSNGSSRNTWIQGYGEATASWRAPLFYDSNDTSYYTDPNGTSRTADIHTNRIGVGQGVNSSWPLIVSGNAYLNAGGYGQAEGSWRAPIFYDSGNTGYYLDPNSTSNISDLVVRGGTSVANITDLTTGTAPIRVTNTGTGTGDVRYIPMISGTSTSSSGYLQHTVLGSVRGSVWGAAFIGVGGNDSYPTVAYTFHYGGYASAPESWRAQLFYDNNDTAYYVDPNSTSRLGYVRPNQISLLNNVDLGTPRWDFKAYVVESQHHYGHNSSQTMYLGESNPVIVGGDIRSPIFYDSNDTGWYSNPNGTSNFNRISTVRTDDWLYIDNNYGHSVVGVYDSYRYQGVFAMGAAYKLPANGANTGNLYGMAWSHPNAGGAAGNLTDHGLLIINNGGFRCAISNSIVASANITAYSDERLKTNWRDMPEDYVTRLAKVKVGIYDRVDQEDVTQVGVSAQSFQQLLPQAIMTAKDEMQTLSVSYGNAALASAVELAKEVVDLRTRVAQLESLITKLIGD